MSDWCLNTLKRKNPLMEDNISWGKNLVCCKIQKLESLLTIRVSQEDARMRPRLNLFVILGLKHKNGVQKLVNIHKMAWLCEEPQRGGLFSSNAIEILFIKYTAVRRASPNISLVNWTRTWVLIVCNRCWCFLSIPHFVERYLHKKFNA